MKNQTSNVIICAAIFLFASLLYARTARFDLVWDDQMVISASQIKLTPDGVRHIFTSQVDRLYRPVRTLFYAAELSSGAGAHGLHATNVALYASACVLMFCFARAISSSVSVAECAAFLFAAHPIHAEVVSSISNGRADLLCAVFSFSCMIAFMSARRGAQTLSVLLYALALMSKETAIVLPAVIFIIAYFKPRSDIAAPGAHIRAAVLRAVPFALTAAAYMVARGAVLGRASQAASWHGGSMKSTLFTSLAVVPDYTAMLFLPVKQCAIYVLPILQSPSPATIMGALLIIVAPVLALLLIRGHFAFSFSILFAVITWIPASNIVPIAAIKASRFMFFPSVGACLAAALVFHKAGSLFAGNRKMKAALPAVLTIAAAAVWGASAYAESGAWKDGFTFWSKATACAPQSPTAWNNFANLQYIKGDAKAAEAGFYKAMSLNPAFPQPYENLAAIYGNSGRYNEAIAMLLIRKSLGAHAATDCRLAFAYRKTGNMEAAAASAADCARGINNERGGGR